MGMFQTIGEEITYATAAFSCVAMFMTCITPTQKVETGTKDVGKYVLMRDWYRKFGFTDKKTIPFGLALRSGNASVNQVDSHNLRPSVAYACGAYDACGGLSGRLVGIANAYMLSKVLNRSFYINPDGVCRDHVLCDFLKPGLIKWDSHTFSGERKIVINVANSNLMDLHRRVGELVQRNAALPERIELTSRYNYISMLRLYLPTGSPLLEALDTGLGALWRAISADLFSDSVQLLSEVARLERKLSLRASSARICAQISVGLHTGNERDSRNTHVTYASGSRLSRDRLLHFLSHLQSEKNASVFVTSDSASVLSQARLRLPGAVTALSGLAESDASMTRYSLLRDLSASRLLATCDVIVTSVGSTFGAYASLVSKPSSLRYMLDTDIRAACTDLYRIACPVLPCRKQRATNVSFA